MVKTAKFTRADYETLPEGFPAELIDGCLVKAPSPTWGHQRITGKVHMALFALVGPDRVVESPMDVFVDDWNILQPDVLVLREPLPRDAPEVGIPLLVVEVLSPSTEHRDRQEKTAIYLRAGVEEVFLVDPESGNVELVTAAGHRRFGPEETVESQTVPGFVISGDALLR